MWSAQQQSMLNAMGYTLYVRPSAIAVMRQVDDSPAQMNTVTASAESVLFNAVMKAARGKDVSQLAIDIHALRGSPQAKRDLWSQLRSVIKS